MKKLLFPPFKKQTMKDSRISK